MAEGINAYFGQPSQSSIVNSPFRHMNDFYKYPYYSKDWNISGYPLLHYHINTLTASAVKEARFIDPLQQRLLDIGSGYYDLESKRTQSFRAYSRISIMTLGMAIGNCAMGYGNGVHVDDNDMFDVEASNFIAFEL